MKQAEDDSTFPMAEGILVSSQALLRASSALLGPIPTVRFWDPPQRNPTFVQLQKLLHGTPMERFILLIKKSLPEERQAVYLTI